MYKHETPYTNPLLHADNDQSRTVEDAKTTMTAKEWKDAFANQSNAYENMFQCADLDPSASLDVGQSNTSQLVLVNGKGKKRKRNSV